MNITINSIKVDGTEVAYTYEEGALTTMDDGKSLRLNIVNPWASPAIYGIDSDITINEGIEITFTVQLGDEAPEPSTPVTEPTYGDVDGDGDIDIVDVLTLNQYLLGIGDLKVEANADVDGDNKITDADALNILKSLVKLVTLPVTK